METYPGQSSNPMTVPFENQGRYLNEIRRQPHWYCTLRKDREGHSWVIPRILWYVGCSAVSILVRLLDPENGGLTLLRNVSSRHRRLEAQCIRTHSELMTLLSKILRAISSCWPDSFLRVREHVLWVWRANICYRFGVGGTKRCLGDK